MKLTITKTELEEVEMKFPVYKKHSSNYYKGISEKEWVCVIPIISSISVSENIYQLDRILINGEDVPEEEFNSVFIEVFSKIKTYKPEYSYGNDY